MAHIGADSQPGEQESGFIEEQTSSNSPGSEVEERGRAEHKHELQGWCGGPGRGTWTTSHIRTHLLLPPTAPSTWFRCQSQSKETIFRQNALSRKVQEDTESRGPRGLGLMGLGQKWPACPKQTADEHSWIILASPSKDLSNAGARRESCPREPAPGVDR